MKAYDHKKIEKKWQALWAKSKVYTTPDKAPGKDNFYLLVEFPYPSGNLHVGHWYAFAVPDILARTKRMWGHNVLYPIGFDAFGLPAENAAIKRGLNPRKWTNGNIAYMKKQLASMGASFDWSREVQTIDPAYYKWTQWMFLQMLKKGLAYQKETAVNWCPKDKTVLANEQVVDGKCERCGSEVIQKQMLQWNLKITDYADRLVDDLDALDWPEQIKESQRNWIGRSEGYEIDFPLDLGKKYRFVILHGFHGFESEGNRNLLGWIKEELEKMGHEVITPALPHPSNPSEKEQVAAALGATEYDENTVICAFSLGAVVAMKVLEQLERPIARLVLAGGFIDPNFKDGKKRGYEKKFDWKFDAEKIRRNAGSITLLRDPKDDSISEDQANKLSDFLGVPLTLCKTNAPHFKGDKEPDVLMWLRPTVRVFTTRPDTLYGASYLVLAPEHPWVTAALKDTTVLSNDAEVAAYVKRANKKTELERQESREKTGVVLKGVKAVNPATGKEIPLWVADYVIGSYGTGAVMGVPAHDERDFEFASRYELPIRQVVGPVMKALDGGGAVRQGEPFLDREAVMCIVKHWEKDEYLCIQWNDHADVRSMISGGIEEGESSVDAGRREILEESGYKNARFVRQVGPTSFVEFYHRQKLTNVRARTHYLYFELENGEQAPVKAEEMDKLTCLWTPADKMRGFLTINEKDRVWDAFTRNSAGAYTSDGLLFDSGEFSGMENREALPKMGEKFGRLVKQYRLRDWIVSRQRYWGVPIPVIHCAKCGIVPVPEKDLPVKLPEVKDYLPEGSGKSPLAKAKKWAAVKCPKCKGKAERETDTLDTFVDSSWYYLRYTDPKNKSKFADAKKMAQWMPVDLYSGGAEHTTMHLLYSRFWHKALYDMKLVKDKEPYARRMNRGIVLGPDGQKMSKSHGNVIDPDEVVRQLGADTVRMYLAFLGPYNEVSSFPWNPDGVVGVRRFLERTWRAAQYVSAKPVPALDAPLHKAIKKVGEDATELKFNTAIAQLMIFLNELEKEKQIGKKQWEDFLRLLAPFAPHIAEELWSAAGDKTSIHKEKWPKYDAKKLLEDTITYAIQVDGKTRGNIVVDAQSSQERVIESAREEVLARIQDARITRTVFVPGRLVNFVLAK